MRREQSVILAKQTCLEMKKKKKIPPNNNRRWYYKEAAAAAADGRLKKVIVRPLSNWFLPLQRENIIYIKYIYI